MPLLRIKTARCFRALLEPARYLGAYSGRGAGKSQAERQLDLEQYPERY
jgi:hypothetical protein